MTVFGHFASANVSSPCSLVLTGVTVPRRTPRRRSRTWNRRCWVHNSRPATDPDGNFIYRNRAAEKLYGWSFSEAAGRNIRRTV
jgi:PAS domain-containing protein